MNFTDEYLTAVNENCWVAANGGQETPTRFRSGRSLLYVFNPATGRHAYLDVETDILLSDEEAEKEVLS